jgi:hypothetical protein
MMQFPVSPRHSGVAGQSVVVVSVVVQSPLHAGLFSWSMQVEQPKNVPPSDRHSNSEETLAQPQRPKAVPVPQQAKNSRGHSVVVVVVSDPQGDSAISQVSSPGVMPGPAHSHSGSQGSAILFHVGDMPPVERKMQ